MNPNQVAAQNGQRPNFLEGIEALSEFEKAETPNDSVSHSAQDRQSIREGWEALYNLKTEDIAEIINEGPARNIEVSEYKTESQNTEIKEIINERKSEKYIDSAEAVNKTEGKSSLFAEAGIKLDFPGLFKETTKGIFGAFAIFKEIFMDTITLVVGKKDKKAAAVEKDPAKAKAAAEKKAENQRKQNNIKAFYEGLKAQIGAVISPEAAQMEQQEKTNINKTIKMGNESYKGIKNSFGRLTTYATSMFERAQLDEEKKAKKVEKEQKMASVSKGPDLNMDKVAEGGFLSSTGGQGAG